MHTGKSVEGILFRGDRRGRRGKIEVPEAGQTFTRNEW
jgi:hypothetical protein